MGELDRAEADQLACIRACSAAGSHYVEFFADLGLAFALAREGRHDAARLALRDAEAVAVAARLQAAERPAYLAHAEGEILLAENRPERAVDLLDRAVRGLAEAELPDFEMPARLALARALDRAGRAAEAESCLLMGVGRARRAGYARHMPAFNDALTRLAVPDAGAAAQQGGEGSAWPDDRYVVRERLGGGGFGDVYRAYDKQAGAEVAIKRLRLARIYDAREVERLLASVRTEVEAASRVRHPGVAKVYQVGRTAGGDAFVVQELVRGRTLRSRIGVSRTSDVREVLDTMSRVAASPRRSRRCTPPASTIAISSPRTSCCATTGRRC